MDIYLSTGRRYNTLLIDLRYVKCCCLSNQSFNLKEIMTFIEIIIYLYIILSISSSTDHIYSTSEFMML